MNDSRGGVSINITNNTGAQMCDCHRAGVGGGQIVDVELQVSAAISRKPNALASCGVRQAAAKRTHKGANVRKDHVAGRIAVACFIAFVLLLLVGAAKAFAFPPGQALDENVKLRGGWGASHRVWPTDLAQQPCTNWQRGRVEFFSPVPAQIQPVAANHANEKTEHAEQFSMLLDDLAELLKDRDIQRLFTWFVVGFYCGYFGLLKLCKMIGHALYRRLRPSQKEGGDEH